MIKPEQNHLNKDLRSNNKVFSGKYKDLTKYLEIKLNNQSFLTINQNIDINIDNLNSKPTNQMKNNLFRQANNNKGVITLILVRLSPNLSNSLSMNSKVMKLKHYGRVSYSNRPLSAQKEAYKGLKTALLTKSANIVGSYKYLQDRRDCDDIKRLIPSISSINNRKHKVWGQISPHFTLASGRTMKQVGRHCPEPLPEVENRLVGMGFTGNNFFNPANLYNQLNTLGGIKWNK